MPPNNEYATREYIRNYRNNNSTRPQYERYIIKAESLEMGVYLQPHIFVSEKKYTELINFVINYSTRKIKVEFSVPGNNKHSFAYSLEIEFKNIDGDIYIEGQDSYRSITIASKFPAKYSLFDNKKHILNRMTRIPPQKSEGPLQPHMPDYSEQLGKWVVYRITFNLAKNKNYRFGEMFKKAQEYNLTSGNFNNPLEIVDGVELNKYVERSMLNFDVLYMVECIISFNYLHDYNLNNEFFFLLHKLPPQSAVHILERIYENKKRIYNPISYLRSEFKRLKDVKIKPNHIPDYCTMMRKIIVTPTTMYMLPPNIETSNRVIRYFKDKKDNFLRVHFSDEASNKIGASSGDINEKHSLALYNRIFHTLNDGIKIGDTHYEFLAFSSSQLRDHSCWFFASTKDLTADDIRNWMGNFTDKTVAKYAARMGQCFSSTRAIQRLLVHDIKEIPDIERNGYVFSDGAFLLGVLDETKSLKENEVYCCTSDPCNPSSRKWITGTCIVYRNPCFHPGDVRIVKAVKCDALKDLVDVLVFPQVGERDIPNQCSGGDLDGDDFTIIYDENLIPEQIEEPMDYKAQKPKKVEKVTMVDIKKFFVNYVFSDQLGRIANAHLARADKNPEGAKHESCIKLAHLHSDAVDFPKTGIPASFPLNLRVKEFPDFMEKPDKAVYQSKKVLGILYRSIKEEDYKPYVDLNFDKRLYVEGYVKYLEEARMLKKSYDRDVKALMNQFGIMTEFEVTSGYIINTHPIDKKKPRDVVKCVMDAMIPIKRHYRKLFDTEFYYFNGSTIITMEASIQMEQKAFAWYYITYHPSEQSDENMISFPWIVGDILCKIALRNHCNDRKNDFIRSLQPTRQQPSQLTVNQNNFTTNHFDINVNNCNNDLFNLKKLIQIK
ncbi:unnamed protein product [Rhizophagus irregularis]|nr:unnamed protein product [Rhizophagus irregularis]